MIDDLWYKNAIIYCLDVKTFMDGNGDGIGDFTGLRERLDYLSGLGVTCLWLLPFYVSPNRDNGYDVSDYYQIDPRLGDLGDFVAFSHQARMHGIRVMVDLVVNHTSSEHPWFLKARREPASRYRDYYIWSKEKPERLEEGLVFPGRQRTNWTYDPAAEAYYFHRFFEFQPDLNIGNADVRADILKIMGFWLELGVSGFRVDAVPFLIYGSPLQAEEQRNRFDLLNEMRELLSWRRGDAILLAEANVAVSEVKPYFGNGDRMQLVFHFPANQALFLSLAREDAGPIADLLREPIELHSAAQWAHFLRNHDELDLGRLSEDQRQQVFQKFGPEPSMQVYGRGLRRRLAPMLDGEVRRIQLAYSLMLTLPGTPVFWYGEEIGMGEHLGLPERDSVRTPMQWSSGAGCGFGNEQPSIRPFVEGRFSCATVNVAAQRQDPSSLLNRIERLIRMRKECPEIGWGRCAVLHTGEQAVLALRYQWRRSSMVAIHNFACSERRVMLAAGELGSDVLVDVFSGDRIHATSGVHKVELRSWDHRWFRVGEKEPIRARSGSDRSNTSAAID
jgi:maltose alpha-D-glucosyltransferase/alpha-amylase